MALTVLSCGTDPISKEEIAIASLKGGKGKNKTLVLSPVFNTAGRSAATGRIMETPVDYTGTLPTDNNNGVVDWDNDGTDDVVEIKTSNPGSYPFHTYEVDVNGVSVNNSLTYAKLLGFADVDGDGYRDIITEGGNPYCYDSIPRYETYSRYNVGYNRPGDQPPPTVDLLKSLAVTSVDRGAINCVIWDLTAYGYECYPFYVDLFEGIPSEVLTPEGYYIGPKNFGQSIVYGDEGFIITNNGHLQAGHTYTLRFRYVDGGNPVDVIFTI